MLARLTFLVIFLLGQSPALSAALAGDGAALMPAGHSHCAEHTGDEGGQHCDHVTQCQCNQACGTGMVTVHRLAAGTGARFVPRDEAAAGTLPAKRRPPFRPPSL